MRPNRLPSRPANRRVRLRGAPALCAVLLAACGVLSPEEQLLTRYFEASRLHDTTVVAKLSDVAFNPMVEGVVQTFEISRVERRNTAERVVLDAQIRTPGGQVVPRTIAVMLERRDGRWFVTDLR